MKVLECPACHKSFREADTAILNECPRCGTMFDDDDKVHWVGAGEKVK